MMANGSSNYIVSFFLVVRHFLFFIFLSWIIFYHCTKPLGSALRESYIIISFNDLLYFDRKRVQRTMNTGPRAKLINAIRNVLLQKKKKELSLSFSVCLLGCPSDSHTHTHTLQIDITHYRGGDPRSNLRKIL